MKIVGAVLCAIGALVLIILFGIHLYHIFGWISSVVLFCIVLIVLGHSLFKIDDYED